MLTEPTVAKLTEQAVGAALDGFELAPKREIAWIARAVQGAIYATMRSTGERADRASNAEVRDELLKFSQESSKLWLRLWKRTNEADSAIWDYAFHAWVDEASDDVEIGEPTDYRAFNQAVRLLEWLSDYLKGTAAKLEPQPPNWRRAIQREERIVRAVFLSPIFREAFGAEPTVNTWPTSKSLGPWADFYQRIVALAFGERATPNLETVLDEARRRHKFKRVRFGPGIIPDEPL
jgi:hypothetical protein